MSVWPMYPGSTSGLIYTAVSLSWQLLWVMGSYCVLLCMHCLSSIVYWLICNLKVHGNGHLDNFPFFNVSVLSQVSCLSMCHYWQINQKPHALFHENGNNANIYDGIGYLNKWVTWNGTVFDINVMDYALHTFARI